MKAKSAKLKQRYISFNKINFINRSIVVKILLKFLTTNCGLFIIKINKYVRWLNYEYLARYISKENYSR